MLLSEGKFPLSDVDPDIAVQVVQAWGRPRAQADTVNRFLEIGGRPTLGSVPLLKTYLQGVIAATVEITPGDSNRIEAVKAGALLYSSVFTYVHGTQTLQVTTDSILNVADRETQDVITDSAQQLNPNTAKNFRRLIGEMLPALSLHTGYLEAASIGAGALHLVVMADHEQASSIDSLDKSLAGCVDPFTDFDNDPGLADLRELFERFGDK